LHVYPSEVAALKMRLRHSPAAALRVSLAAGTCALGGILFSAAAQANDGEPDLKLTAPVVSVVEEAAQTTTALTEKAARSDAASLDPARELAEQLPLPGTAADLPGTAGSTPVKDITAPAADIADNLIDQLPVVSQALPGDPVSAVIEPAADAVDSAVETVGGAAGQVVESAVDPAAGTVRPAQPEAPAAKPTPETTPTAADGPTAKSSATPAEGIGSGARPTAGPVPHQAAPCAQAMTEQPAAAAPLQDSAAILITQSVPQAGDDMRADRGTPGHGPASPPAPAAGTGASSATGSGSSGAGAATLPPEEPEFLFPGNRSGPVGNLAAPAAPTFDPGSTPD
jgi:hypothetical protein